LGEGTHSYGYTRVIDQVTSVGEVEEKLEPLPHTAGEIIKGYSHFGK